MNQQDVVRAARNHAERFADPDTPAYDALVGDERFASLARLGDLADVEQSALLREPGASADARQRVGFATVELDQALRARADTVLEDAAVEAPDA